MKVDDECGIMAHYAQMERQLSDVRKMRHFLFDIVHRYPQLRGVRNFDELQQCALVSHGEGGRQADWPMSRDAFELSLEVAGDAKEFSVNVNVARGGSERARRRAEQFSAHIDAIVSNPDAPVCAHEQLRRWTFA
jgi:hypothetical protein